AAERVINFVQKARSGRVAKNPVPAPLQSDLCRDDHFLSLRVLRQALTDQLFSTTESVDRSSINKIYPELQRRANGFERFLFIGSIPHDPANRPCTQSDTRNLAVQVLHCYIFHGTPTSGSLLQRKDFIIRTQDDNKNSSIPTFRSKAHHFSRQSLQNAPQMCNSAPPPSLSWHAFSPSNSTSDSNRYSCCPLANSTNKRVRP